MNDQPRGGLAYIPHDYFSSIGDGKSPSPGVIAAAEAIRKLASQFTIERRQDAENKFMFRIVKVRKATDHKPTIPMHINFSMQTIQQEETQAILSVFDQLEALKLKCDKLEHERDLWKEEAERWRAIKKED
jgi:hypothetical protein